MQLTLEQLKLLLWRTIESTRSDLPLRKSRELLIPLFFLKRCADVFEKQQEEVVKSQLAKGRSQTEARRRAESPSYYAAKGNLFVPSKARWQELQGPTAHGVGDRLNSAISSLENSNPILQDIFAGIDFNRPARESRTAGQALHRLVELLAEISLQDEALESPSIAYKAFDFLLQILPAETKRRENDFYAPKQVAALMVALTKPRSGESVYDPTCGSGGLLIEATRFIESEDPAPAPLALYGQERSIDAWAICRMRLILRGIGSASIELGDTLSDPRLLAAKEDSRRNWLELCESLGRPRSQTQGSVRRFDTVLANPPFGLKRWGYDLWAQGDPFLRDRYGCPPNNNGDFAFLQHAIASLKPGGRGVLVCPYGPLFRGGAEQRIRKRLIEDDVVEAVIGLAPNLFYNTSIPTCLVVIRSPGSKSAARQGKILFVSADRDFRKDRDRNYLDEVHRQRILDAYISFQSIPDFAWVGDREEIEDCEFDLNPARYQLRWQEQRLRRQFEEAALHKLSDLTIATPTPAVCEDETVEENTLLLSSAGKPLLLAPTPDSSLSRTSHRLNLDPTKVYTGYLAAFLASESGRAVLKSMSTGKSAARISRKALDRVPVPLPPLETQQAIAKTDEELHSLARGVERLRARFTMNLQNLDQVDTEIRKIRRSIQVLEESGDIQALIEGGESKRIEFKAALAWNDAAGEEDRGIANRMMKEIAAFLNSEGGVLLVGVHDDGTIRGLDVDLLSCFGGKRDDLLLFWKDKLKNSIGEPAFTLVDYSLRGVGKKEVLVVECKRSPRAVFLKGDFYIRMNPSAEKIVGQDLLAYCQQRFPGSDS